MKKMLSSLVLLLILVGVMGSCVAKSIEDNPIDSAFANDFQKAQSTVEINYVSEKYLQAWKKELVNAANVLKGKYKFKEDKIIVDEYLAGYEKAAKAAGNAEWLNWADIDSPPNNRLSGTGAASASMSAQAIVYKQATCNLINIIKGVSSEGQYQYLYSGKGAELEKIKPY